jgi:hypothetical protein
MTKFVHVIAGAGGDEFPSCLGSGLSQRFLGAVSDVMDLIDLTTEQSAPCAAVSPPPGDGWDGLRGRVRPGVVDCRVGTWGSPCFVWSPPMSPSAGRRAVYGPSLGVEVLSYRCLWVSLALNAA